ncbi:hypothetical protein EPH95_05430 [Salicibibacter halophilus]|uniref:Uncharacterized protein n=1 Tax=Salicibibacter halophilus TaxID=2502791 RepID=A0A514LFQ6_9BACI|nr:hypothetical protein [Salicibibacter halophilus]QDI90688.1 hypothetical protein EPH95_05430 [Salicibibacter halophilus]
MANTKPLNYKKARNRLLLFFIILLPLSMVIGRYLSEWVRSNQIANLNDIVPTAVVSLFMFGLVYVLFKNRLIKKVQENVASDISQKRIIFAWGGFLFALVLLFYGLPLIFNVFQ